MGEKNARFTAYKDDLRAKSEYFHGVRTRGHEDQTVSLNDTFPDVGETEFRAYMYWVDKGVLHLDSPRDVLYRRGGVQRARLYVLATKLKDVGLRKLLIREFVRVYASPTATRLPGRDAMNYLYDQIDEKTALHKLLVDLYVARVDRDLYERQMSEYTNKFRDGFGLKAARRAGREPRQRIVDALGSYLADESEGGSDGED